MEYTIKTVRGVKEKPYPCNGYTVTNLPESGYYVDHPEILGLPKGQKTKLVLEDGKETVLLLPRDGTFAYVIQNGVTIDRYPKGKREDKRAERVEKRREKELRVVEEPQLDTLETDRDGL
jgi:hypothetical protein